MPKKRKTTTIAAAEFKAKCLKVMESVRATGAEYVITKHGKPVARLVPVSDATTPLYGRLSGMTVHEGDVLAPVDEEWDAEGG